MPLTRDELNRRLASYCKPDGLDFQRVDKNGQRYCHLYGDGDELHCPFLDGLIMQEGEKVYKCKRLPKESSTETE